MTQRRRSKSSNKCEESNLLKIPANLLTVFTQSKFLACFDKLVSQNFTTRLPIDNGGNEPTFVKNRGNKMQKFINGSEKTDHRKNVKMQGIDKTIPSGEGLWPFHGQKC